MLSSHSLEVLVNFQIPEILAGYLKLKVTHSSKDLGGTWVGAETTSLPLIVHKSKKHLHGVFN
jgi:hypothetical protein